MFPWKKHLFLLLFFLPSLAFSFCYKDATPWFTGPLVTGSATNQSPQTYSFQPYFIFRVDDGFYDDKGHVIDYPHTFIFQSLATVQAALNSWLDATLGMEYFYRKRGDLSAQGYGDTYLQFGFQILNDKRGTIQPSIRFTLTEVFPTGRYQHFDPIKRGLEATSTGSYITGASLRFRKLVYWMIEHPMSLRLQFSYELPSPVHVSGFHSYGGGYGTKGTVKPPHVCFALFGYELSITRHFAFAFDLCNFFGTKSSFSGTKGVDVLGKPAVNTFRHSYSLSVAPALEYNFNADYGVIAGTWFSIKGINDIQFMSYLISLGANF